MKHTTGILLIMMMLLLCVSGVMAAGNLSQSRQLVEQRQKLGDLSAALRQITDERDTLALDLDKSRGEAAALRQERDAITRQLGDTLLMLQAADTARQQENVRWAHNSYPGYQGDVLLKLAALDGQAQALVLERDGLILQRDDAITARDTALNELADARLQLDLVKDAAVMAQGEQADPSYETQADGASDRSILPENESAGMNAANEAADTATEKASHERQTPLPFPTPAATPGFAVDDSAVSDDMTPTNAPQPTFIPAATSAAEPLSLVPVESGIPAPQLPDILPQQLMEVLDILRQMILDGVSEIQLQLNQQLSLPHR
ncbi:MAG: hypothetical protein E7319_01560 [Clostridiales bacterium]|nr:hypothetical protein [Clostridiales bacterium]